MKLIKKSALVALIVTALFFFWPSPSGAAEENFGQCQKNAQPHAQHYNAPGQSGNGPLNVHVDDDGELTLIWPKNAFAGAGACP